MKKSLLTASIAAALLAQAGWVISQQPPAKSAAIEEVRKNAASPALPAKDKLAVDALLTRLEKADVSEEKRRESIVEFLKTASPQVKLLFAGKSASAPATAPATAPPAGPKPGAPISFENVPVPAPKAKGLAKEAKKKPPAPLTVDSNKLEFQQDNRTAIFTEDVKFRSPSMNIDCEELKLLFKPGALDSDTEKKPAAPPPPTPKGAKPAGATAAAAPTPAAFDPLRPTQPDPLAPPTTGAAPADPRNTTQDKIEKAWAKGNGSIVTIVRPTPKGVTVAKCGEAYFDQKTGDLTLKINPDVEQAGKRLTAVRRDAVIIVHGDGKITGEGVTTKLPGQDATEPKDASATPEVPKAKPVKDAKPNG